MVKDKGNVYRGLRKRYFVILLSIASAIPLASIGGILYYQYSAVIQEKVTTQLSSLVIRHKESIEKFLKETTSVMRVVSQLSSLEKVKNKAGLQALFETLQNEYDQAFEDLGVIDSRGNHVAYVGPFNLLGKDYSQTAWYKETMEKRIFISDVFLGFRQVPHFIIAIKQENGRESYVLRATVNAARFGSLVENVRLGNTGEAFIISKEGFFQTRSRWGGRIMDRAAPELFDMAQFEGVKFWKLTEKSGRRILRAKTWMKDKNWLLVVQQDMDDAYGELYATRNTTVFIFIFGAFLVGLVAFLTTRLLVSKIERIDREKELLDAQLIQSHKLASIGELSAGIAHEINNPLAVIGEEAGWMQDLLKRETMKDIKDLEDFKDSLREITQQAGRCKEITHKLLSFARKMESVIKDVNINKLMDDIIDMREREASFSNIEFIKNYNPHLPYIHSDPSLLRQVMLNLINNAIDAIQKGGQIRIQTGIGEEDEVEIKISDTGMGIPADNLTKIFDPFFTTKPPGKGTGLGLSICHGIIEKLGGTISVTSQVGKGTTFVITLPLEKTKGVA